jgi:hypothetical protein
LDNALLGGLVVSDPDVVNDVLQAVCNEIIVGGDVVVHDGTFSVESIDEFAHV